MPGIKDLTGKKFGKLTVLERDLTKKGGAAYWICQCDCGNIKSIRGTNLTTTIRPTRSCGCLAKEKARTNLDLNSQIGKRYGLLTVLERDLTKPIGHSQGSYWICQCDCGNIKSISLNALASGKTKSCGCLKSELLSKRNTLDIANQRFGKLVAKENTFQKNSKGEYIWRCECDCGNTEVYCTATNLNTRAILSCGCLKESKGEYIINSILIEYNKHFAREYSFQDLTSDKGNLLRFDFAILDDVNQPIRLIEFDGAQHFIPNPYFDFETIKKHDERKNLYAKNNNIPLVRVPYTKIKEITIENLFDNTFLI